MRLWDNLQPRLVLAENVRQVLDHVTRGEVDAGIVYSSDMAGVREARIVAYTAGGSHSPIQYPIAIIKQTGNNSAAQRFVDLVLGDIGQTIMKKYGFLGSR